MGWRSVNQKLEFWTGRGENCSLNCFTMNLAPRVTRQARAGNQRLTIQPIRNCYVLARGSFLALGFSILIAISFYICFVSYILLEKSIFFKGKVCHDVQEFNWTVPELCLERRYPSIDCSWRISLSLLITRFT